MRFHTLFLLLLFLFIVNVVCKGGGGGGRGGGGSSGGGSGGRGSSGSSGGGRTGGSSGSGSSGSGSTGKGSSGGNGSSGKGSSGGSGSSGGGRGSAPSNARSPGGGIGAGGGSGSFRSNPPSYQASTSRQNFNNYHPTYSGAYGSGRYSGYYGNYRPGIPYFFVIPSFMYLGYAGAYHRYGSQGAYYAPEIASQGTGSTNILINGTTYSSDTDNFHYTFNITARSDQFVTIDMGYFGSSDLNTNPADFIYRLTMAHVVEYDDLNNNGFYDAQEPILAISSLQKLNWLPMTLTNRTVPNNPSQTYLETVTAANVTYNNTGTAPVNPPVFGISLTFRSTNLQLNGTASIPLQPNSVEYDVQLQNYPPTIMGAIHPRVALAQIITTRPFNNLLMDVNTTTPIPIAQQIKTNVTYGASVGNYSEGRLEYQPTVNITNMAGISTSTWTNLMDPAQVNRLNAPNTWGWGSLGVDDRSSTMFLVTFNNNTSSSYQLSGLAYLDTDIINSAINAGSTLLSSGTKIVTQGVTALSVAILLIFSL